MLIFTIAALFGSQAAHAQFGSGIVYDPTQGAHAIQQIQQGENQLQKWAQELQNWQQHLLKEAQIYTTAVQTHNQIVTMYNLAYQMSRLPQNLAARYKTDWAQWSSLAAPPNAYGTSSALVNALNFGGLPQAQQGYSSAFVQVQSYPSGNYSSLDSRTQAKEPFWQQSYTDLVRYVILLHRVKDGYVTLLDVFRTVISSEALERMLIEVGRKLVGSSFIGISGTAFLKLRPALANYRFDWNEEAVQYLAPWSEELENFLATRTGIACSIYQFPVAGPAAQKNFESISYWYWQHWKFFRSEVKTSIIQGIAVFLSLFETDPDVRRVFCPPKELYDGKECEDDPQGSVLPPFDELIDSGKVVGLNFPVALNPALAKIIGTMMKIDYQRAVQLRIPKMDAEPHRHFRPTVFVCDEYQNYATVGGDNPTGDERFLSISRQPRCIPIVATQSISSLKEALPNEGVKTLLQAFRTKVFLSTADPDTARFASEICGKTDRTRISYTVSESSSNANVGWLSGRTSSNKGSVSASKQYQKQKEPLFDEKVFFELKNAQAIVAAFDGISPQTATYCYLKPDFLPIDLTWFEQEHIGFDPRRV